MSVVYVMKVEGKDLFKVGYCSTRIEQRLKNLRVGCPYPLYLYATIPCNSDGGLEKRIHSMLKQTHTKGEWYDVSLETINTVLLQFQGIEFSTKKHKYFDEIKRTPKPKSEWKKLQRTGPPKDPKKRKTKGPRIKQCKRVGCTNKTLGRRRLYCSNSCGNTQRQRDRRGVKEENYRPMLNAVNGIYCKNEKCNNKLPEGRDKYCSTKCGNAQRARERRRKNK